MWKLTAIDLHAILRYIYNGQKNVTSATKKEKIQDIYYAKGKQRSATIKMKIFLRLQSYLEKSWDLVENWQKNYLSINYVSKLKPLIN